jgi:hypothetical protein
MEQVIVAFNNIQFTLEEENNNKINFLDITIHRLQSKLEYKVFCKPTGTSTIIHSATCHPIEHKKMTFNFHFNHLNTYPINKISKNLEVQLTRQIAQENNYLFNNMAFEKFESKKL